MLVWMVTALLALIAAAGWLILKRDPDRYIHEKKSPINFFFRWGRFCHHLFKVAIIAILMLLVFSLYKYLLNTSNAFAAALAVIAGIVLAGGKELLDKYIQAGDVVSSVVGIALGFFIILLCF